MSIDNWLAAIVDIGKQLDTLQQHIAIDRHGFNKLVREAEAAKEKVRQLTAEVGELRVEREQAEQPRPEPMLGMRDWLVNRGDPTWLRHIIGRNWTVGNWRYSYDYYGPHGEGRTHGIQGNEALLISDKWLPIPPRPETPEGYELRGEVREPKPGEYWIDVSMGGCGVVGSGNPDMSLGLTDMAKFGYRRWILRKVEPVEQSPPYRKGQLVCMTCLCLSDAIGIVEAVYADRCIVRQLVGPYVFDSRDNPNGSWFLRDLRLAVASDLTPEQWMEVVRAEVGRKRQ